MSLPEFSSFADALRGLDRRNHEELKQHIACSRALRELAREREYSELAYCLNAIGNLLAALATPGDFMDGGALQSSVIKLVNSVESSLSQILEAELKQPVAPQPAAPRAAGPRPKPAPEPSAESKSPGPVAEPIQIEFDIEEQQPTQSVELPEVSLPDISLPTDEPPSAAPEAPQADAPETPEMEVDPDLGRDNFVLGRFLLELEQITRAELAAALRMHRSSKLPVGECLLMMGKVFPDKIMETLRLQQRIREENEHSKTGMDQADAGPPSSAKPEASTKPKQAAKGKPGTKRKQGPLSKLADRTSLRSHIPTEPKVEMHVTKQMFLGEVFLGADMITTGQLEKAMHINHLEGIRIGEALLKIGAIDEAGLECGLELQKRLRNIAQHSSADARARVKGS